MADIDSPRYPVFIYDDLVFPSDFVIEVEIGASVKRVRFATTYLMDGVYRINPFTQLTTALAQALSQVLGAVSNSQTPDGVFSSGVSVTASFLEASEKNFPVVSLLFGPTIATAISISMDFEYAKTMGLNNTGFTVPVNLLVPQRQTFDFTPAGLWAPNSYNAQETRIYTQDLNVTSSAFTPSVFTVNKWGTERVGLRLYMPVINAEFIFQYRREDPNFSQYTQTDWPNNILQQMIDAARNGNTITVVWSSSESEEFTIQEPERIVNFNSNITDAASERMFDVTLMMVKV